MKPYRSLWVILLFILVLAAGCKPVNPPVEPTRQVEPTLAAERSIAPVNELEVLRLAGDPPQVRVVVRGELPNGCTTIESVSAALEGDTFSLALPTFRPAGAPCLTGGVVYERVVSLDTADLPAGTYTVRAGGASQSFDLAQPQTSVANNDQPQPEPTVQPTVEPTPAAPADNGAVVPVTNAGSDQPPAPTDCINKAAFYEDVTVPDGTSFRQGEAFTKTWRIRNVGTCDWNESYRLIFYGGENMSADMSYPMPVIKAGEIQNISINFIAPPRGGEQVSRWVFQTPAGERFGVNAGGINDIYVKINVSFFNDLAVSEVKSEGKASSGTVNVSTNTSSVVPPCAVGSNADFENRVIDLVNQLRADSGVPALKPEPLLRAAAFLHSADMACNRFTGHAGSDTSTFTDRVKAQGYPSGSVWENIAYGGPLPGYGSPEDVFAWWKGSATHYANMMNPKATSIGVGYAALDGSPYINYYTINFARP